MNTREHYLYVRFYPHNIDKMSIDEINEKIKLINIEKRNTVNNYEFLQLSQYEQIYQDKINNLIQ